MEELTARTEIFLQSFKAFGVKFMSVLPNVLGAIFILLLGWILARVVSTLITKGAQRFKINKLASRTEFTDFLQRANVKSTPAQLLGKMMKYIILLVALLMAADTMNWTILSQEIGKLLTYLPRLFMALVFFIIGTYIAGFVRDFIRAATSSLGISAGRILGSFVYWMLLIIVTLTALEQAGFNTSLPSSYLLILLGTICLSAAISYGFASREILSNILSGFYARKSFKIGQIIEVEGERGEIIATSNINVTLQQENGEKVVIPSEVLVRNKVRVLG